MIEMEKEEKNERGRSMMMMMRPAAASTETAELFLQWGTRKRLRCVRIRSSGSYGGNNTNTTTPAVSANPPSHLSSSSSPTDPTVLSPSSRIRRKITSRFLSVAPNDEKHLSFPQTISRLTRNSEAAAVTLRSESRRVSPEKEERSYTTRGSVTVVTHLEEENGGCGGGKAAAPLADVNCGRGDEPINRHYHHNHSNNYKNANHHNSNRGGNLVWPKLYIALSSKEKEEDFLAMKGCKLPQRPKKRAKLIQRTILLVSPGAWLTDMSLERYEVREKKTTKKRPRGLKAMGNMESDSE